jgi:hypothetical protein
MVVCRGVGKAYGRAIDDVWDRDELRVVASPRPRSRCACDG